jgi:hypothetical protein
MSDHQNQGLGADRPPLGDKAVAKSEAPPTRRGGVPDADRHTAADQGLNSAIQMLPVNSHTEDTIAAFSVSSETPI